MCLPLLRAQLEEGYDFAPHGDILSIFQDFHHMDDATLTALSQHLEPREQRESRDHGESNA
jgi:hypothetical protein